MNRHLTTGFTIGLLAFILINVLAAHLSSDCGLFTIFGTASCADGITRLGWPLRFYEGGGFVYYSSFSLAYLLIDIAVGVGLSLILGWLYARSKKPLPN